MKTTSGDGEKNIEKYLDDACLKNNILYYKQIGIRGIPDRMFINKGIVVFAELKTKGKKPSESQKARIAEMKRHGAIVYVIDTIEDAKLLIEMLAKGKIDENFKRKLIDSDAFYEDYKFDY